MWIILIVVAAVVILLWMVIGYVGFRTAICRGHELNITDRETLKGTSWDQYYEEIQEGIEWINRQEAEDIFIRSEDGFKLHGRLMDQPGAKGTVLMFHGYRTHPEVDFSASSHVYYECGNRIVHIDQRAAGESEGKVHRIRGTGEQRLLSVGAVYCKTVWTGSENHSGRAVHGSIYGADGHCTP